MIHKTMVLLGLMTFLITGTAYAQLFGSDDSSIERVLKEVKKVNSRLIELRNAQLPGLQANQAEQLQQINQLQGVVSNIQGSLESMAASNNREMERLATRISQSEMAVRDSMKAQDAQQKADLAEFKKDVVKTFDQMKQSFARDMETFATANQENFKTLADKNAQSLSAVELQLNQSNVRTDKVIDHLSQVIKQEGDHHAELVALLQQNKGAVQSGFESVAANNQVVNSNNKTIKQVLANALAQQESTHKQVEALQAELIKTQSEIESAKKAIGAMKNIMDRKMDAMFKAQDAIHAQTVASEKLMAGFNQKLAEVQAMERAAGERFGKLVETSQALANHSNQLSQKVDLASQKVDASQSEANLANQKMTKLIEILKAIALQQDKLDQLLTGEGEASPTGQLLKANAEVKEALGDLRRKANVSIARNNEILKILNSSSSGNSNKAAGNQENPPQ